MRIAVALLVLTALISFYIIAFRLNRKQELPEDVKEKLKSCDACDTTSCGLHPGKKGTDDE